MTFFIFQARLLSRGRLDPRDPWRFPLGPRGEPLRVPDIFENEHKHPQVCIFVTILILKNI